MGIDEMKMEEVKDWIRNGIVSCGKRDNNLFEAGENAIGTRG